VKNKVFILTKLFSQMGLIFTLLVSNSLNFSSVILALEPESFFHISGVYYQ